MSRFIKHTVHSCKCGTLVQFCFKLTTELFLACYNTLYNGVAKILIIISDEKSSLYKCNISDVYLFPYHKVFFSGYLVFKPMWTKWFLVFI